MIIVKLLSGLGNQLFQYAVARQLSLQVNTPLKLDTSFFALQNLRSYKLDYFNIEATVADSKEIHRLTEPYFNISFSGRIRRKLGRILGVKHGYYKEKATWLHDDSIYSRKKNTYIDGYWQNHKYFIHLDPVVKQELTLKPAFFKNISGLAAQIEADNAVSVHVRRGDYLTDTAAASLMGTLSTSYYEQAIALVKEKVHNPAFYFFSDDPDWIKNQSGLMQSNCHVIEGLFDYEDLALMSRCKHNIIANSSFSWWGAFLNNNPDKIVIAPKQWVVPQHINSIVQIQMPSWVLI